MTGPASESGKTGSATAPGRDREIELKLELDPEAAAVLRQHPMIRNGLGAALHSASVYYDTKRNALRDAGVSLRVRRTGSSFVQTLKSKSTAAAGLFDRGEWEKPLDGPEPDLDFTSELDLVLARDEVRNALMPTFKTHIRRQSCMLQRPNGLVELVIDEGEVVAGRRSQALVELELELKHGSTRALFDVAREIRALVPLRLGVMTKSERGSRLAGGKASRATKAEAVALRPEMSAGDVFRTIAFSCLRHFRANEPLVLAARDVDALHQARVALRRLRSELSLFKPWIGDRSTERFQAPLRALASRLGEARNLDVLLRRRSEDLSKDVRQQLVGLRSQAYDAAIETLNAPETVELMLDFAEWAAIDAPSDIDTGWDGPVDRLAATILDRFWNKVKRSGKRFAELDDAERHALRIAGKKLRYAGEFFATLAPPQATEKRDAFLASLTDLQDVLGDLNDIATESELRTQLKAAGIMLPRIRRQQASTNEALLPVADLAFRRLREIGPYWSR